MTEETPRNDERDERERDDVSDGSVHDPDFDGLIEKLHTSYGFDFRQYKKASVFRRTKVRMAAVHVESFADYIAYLDRHADEHVALFNAILINVTEFFRDPEAWTFVRDEVIPRLVEAGRETKSIRMWSAGCSSGEEPYSAAILLAEHLGDGAREYDVKIYTTDIDDDALATGRQGLYRLDQVKHVEPPLLDRYFVREGQMYRFRRDLRRWCIFGRHNLVNDPPLSHLDMIICRNVLIYFGTELQDRILPAFHYALREGGYLFLGKAESLLARSKRFTPLHLKWRVFQRSPAAATEVGVPLLRDPIERRIRTTPEARSEAQHLAGRLQRVIDTLQSGVAMIDLSDTILTWNAAAAALFDIPTQSALGKKFRDLDISYRIEGLRARIEEVKLRQTSSRIDDVTFARRSGEIAHASITMAPLFDDHRRVVGVLVAAVDATEQVRLREEVARISEQHATANEELQSTNEELETTNEELQSTNEELETTVDELQAANSELASLNSELERQSATLKALDIDHLATVESVADAAFALDPEFRVVSWSQGAERLWGLRTDQVVGREFFTLPIGPVTSVLREPLQRLLENRRPLMARDIRIHSASGDVRRALARLTAVAASEHAAQMMVLVWLEDTASPA